MIFPKKTKSTNPDNMEENRQSFDLITFVHCRIFCLQNKVYLHAKVSLYVVNNPKKISIVVPCYREESGLKIFHEELCKNIPSFYQHEIIYINDGSEDNTLDVIKSLAEKDKSVQYISFSRNFGHQNALKAGYDFAEGDCAISMDADMQHPPEVLLQLLNKWEEGYETVYTFREDHRSISTLKKSTSRLFYWFMNKISDIPID